MSEPTTKKSVTRTGQCFCGAVKYTVTGDPINVRACHCKDCQRLTGSAFFARALFPKAQVTITGQVAEFPSNDDVIRKFCPRCGSQLFVDRKSRPDAISISLGSFDNLDGILVPEHIWVSDKQAWYSIPAGTKQHRQTP